MIVTRTPLRVSLFGGGTDFPDFYQRHGGFCLSAAVNKYIDVVVKERFDNQIVVNYSHRECVKHVDDLRHELVRESMKTTGVLSGVEITTLADIPSEGCGLGSSSAVTIGLLLALHTYRGNMVTEEQLARQACAIEIHGCGKPIGKQDQYIAAYGGLRSFTFRANDDVNTSPRYPLAAKRAFEQRVMLFYTGLTRQAETILTEQKRNIPDKQKALIELRDIARQAEEYLQRGDIGACGALLGSTWELKKSLALGIITNEIQAMYDLALNNGATGARLCGAGGGGFLLVLAEPENQASVRFALRDYRELPIAVANDGARVLLNVRS